VTKSNICFNIFHIPQLGEDYARRFACYINLKQILSLKYNNLNSETIKIQNSDDYDNFIKNYYKLNVRDLLTYGEIGLWASNLVAFDNFLKSEYDYLMLLEDDVVLYNNFFELFEGYIEELPEDFDIFSLHVREMEHVRFTDFENQNSVVPLYQWWDTGGVLFSRKGVERILKAVELNGIDCPVDLFFYDCKIEGDDYSAKEPNATDKVVKKYNFVSYGLHPKSSPLMYKLVLKSNIWELPRLNFNER
jgi:GR25 family glycosyltransferase involved in LPS biosynthesis